MIHNKRRGVQGWAIRGSGMKVDSVLVVRHITVALQKGIVAERTPIRGRKLTRINASTPGVECWTRKVIGMRHL